MTAALGPLKRSSSGLKGRPSSGGVPRRRKEARRYPRGAQHFRQIARRFRGIFDVRARNRGKGLIHAVPILDLDGRQIFVRQLLMRVGFE